MKKISLFLLTLPLCTIGSLAPLFNAVAQQVSADGTVSTTVTSPDGKNFNINDGTTRGTNLFHSFKEFSVPTGGSANFNNANSIQNIISRVTGGSISSIDGLIKANGAANLFLLNPAGIVFGPNASLNIGGSFLGSTANSFVFDNGFEFSATDPQAPPLLTINIPIGLRFRDNPGTIQVQGDGQGLRSVTDNLIDTTSGLRVQQNQTLALVGGDVSLEGATLKTAGGRIELGSVKGSELVNITPINKGFALNYGNVKNFGNIQLSQQTAVDASGVGGGDIQVWGRSITLSDGSQIENSTLGAEKGGALVVNASERVEAVGTSSDGKFSSGLFTQVYAGATGAGGDLTVNTQELFFRNGAVLSTSTAGQADAGSIKINATDTISFAGVDNNGTISGIFSDVYTGAEGKVVTLNSRQTQSQSLMGRNCSPALRVREMQGVSKLMPAILSLFLG